jgi:Polyketide cyclase / dehydrase and lipid transport
MPEICESGVINASADRVWSVLRDFAGAKNWAENMESSDVEGGCPGDQVGVIRRLVFQGGAEVHEQLIALSDHDRYFRYALLAPKTLPIHEYSGRVRVIPITDSGKALVEWCGNFSIREGNPDDVRAWVRGIYKTGIESMRAYVESIVAQATPDGPEVLDVWGAHGIYHW